MMLGERIGYGPEERVLILPHPRLWRTLSLCEGEGTGTRCARDLELAWE